MLPDGRMLDSPDSGVLYTEHSRLRSASVASLWSYETRSLRHSEVEASPSVACEHEYWLSRSDPLLTTMLPGTNVSLLVNYGDEWRLGDADRRPPSAPRAFLAGPVTRPVDIHFGDNIEVIGAVIPAAYALHTFGVPPSDLVDQLVPLNDLLAAREHERFLSLLDQRDIRRRVAALGEFLGGRALSCEAAAVGLEAVEMIKQRSGRVNIDAIAKEHGFSQRHFARRFSGATGLAPKLFARVTRFQSLVRQLLAHEHAVNWASLAATAGYCDQAHMINDFRSLSGWSPAAFMRAPGRETRLHSKPHLRSAHLLMH